MINISEIVTMLDRAGLVIIEGQIGIIIVAVILVDGSYDSALVTDILLEHEGIAARCCHVDDSRVGLQLEEFEIGSTLDDG